jgi:uncharacterized protein (TIGR02266 family)
MVNIHANDVYLGYAGRMEVAEKRARVERIIADLLGAVAGGTSSPQHRTLHTRLLSYRAVVVGWAQREPTEEQCSLMLYCVEELAREVAQLGAAKAQPSAAPLSRRRSPTSPREERRSEQRIPLEVEISLSSESEFFTGLTGDISRGGILIRTYKNLPVGTALALTFTLPEGSVSGTGKVRWIREQEDGSTRTVGVVFEELPEESRQAIERFCATRPPLYYDVDEP